MTRCSPQDPTDIVDFNTTLKGFNPKEIKAHAAEILKAGGALYDALGQEPELREHRARAVAGHVDTDFVERSVQEAISQVGVSKQERTTGISGVILPL